ncbi:MAG: cyclopropane-fatty-acyl-phospholipid synthase family protein [Myxococcota bacterium]
MTERTWLRVDLPRLVDLPVDLSVDLPARLARTLVLKRLDDIDFGQLTVVDEHGAHSLGRGVEGPRATIHIHDPSAWTAIALGGSLGAGESYMDGLWSTDDLVATVRVLLRSSTRLTNLDGSSVGRLRGALDGIYHRVRRNTRAGSRRNIGEHYDLGNAFYRLWLDDSMMYSSAIWERDDMSLEQAQKARLARICGKLRLEPDDHLLEIGSGWGALAIYAAKHAGCRVTTTTISQAQYDLTRERVKEAGLEDRVTVLLDDYRDLRGRYDKLVTIEMIEAVGAEYLDSFFGQIGRLLRPEGLGLVQAITIPDDRYSESVGRVDFIKRHIFPGGQLPSLHAMTDAWHRMTDLRLLHYEDFGDHYARTLREWRVRFDARRGDIASLGYSARFQRMWEFYLSACEGAFVERHCGVAQLLLARPLARRPTLASTLNR